MRRIVWTLILCLPLLAWAQGSIDGYMKSKGQLDLALSYSYESSDIYYAGKNEIDYSRTTQSIGTFAAWGLTNRINLIGNLPLINGNLQDGSLYVKGLIWSGKAGNLGHFNVIGALGYSAPLSDYETESGDAIGQQTEAILPRLVAQFNFNNGFFINGRYGYGINQDPVPDTDVYSLKVGYGSSKFYADLWWEVQGADGGKDYRGTGDLRAESFRELGVEYQRLGGVFYYAFKPKNGVFLGWGTTLEGRNTPKITRLSVGYVHQFDFSK